jgi:hypothetical protein
MGPDFRSNENVRPLNAGIAGQELMQGCPNFVFVFITMLILVYEFQHNGYHGTPDIRS